MTQRQREILCDPQTSGGLLVMVNDDSQDEFLQIARDDGLDLKPIGQMLEATDSSQDVLITVT